MRLLADENLHAGIVAWLRLNGHDVTYAAETLRGEPDEVVLARAREEIRVVVTDDKDFGDLVVRRRLSTAGVLLLRQSTRRSRSGSPASPRTGRRSSGVCPGISW